VVQAICDLSLPDYMSNIVDNGVLNGNVNYILQTGGKMILITFAQRGLPWSLPAILPPGSPPLPPAISLPDVFKRVPGLFPTLELDKFSPASLITRTTNDITQIQLLTYHDDAHGRYFTPSWEPVSDQGYFRKAAPYILTIVGRVVTWRW